MNWSRYAIFCSVVETGNFTRTAQMIGYSQSAVSQTMKTLEEELNTTLLNRQKGNITLTADGEKYMPYIRAIATAEEALQKKMEEMAGLENTMIRIGTIASVSQHLLPPLIARFKEKYPKVRFVLQQGEYTNICQWAREGEIDFGFINARADASGLELHPLYNDRMMAVLPEDHPLAGREMVSLKDLAGETMILLDEGEYSLPLEAFAEHGLEAKVEYKVYDDTSILAMIRQGLGISIMYRLALSDQYENIVIRPIEENLERTVAMVWRNWDTMPAAARKFAEFIIKR